MASSDTNSLTEGLSKVKERKNLGSQDLFDSATVGDGRRVKWALQALADPNAETQPVRLRPLHVCAVQGHVTAAQLLLEYEADITSADNQLGYTPLTMAAMAGHREVVRLLVASSAPLDGPEVGGTTPLLQAATMNYAEICEILIAAGADVNITLRQSAEVERVREAIRRRNSTGDWKEVLFGKGLQLDDPLRVEGVTPLHIAANSGNARTCGYLLDMGARHGTVDVLLRSSLMLAGERGHAAVTSLLLEHKAAVGANIEGHSVATLAARAGHAAILQLLVEFRVIEVNFATWAGGPAMLHVAAFHGRGGCVALLCERDADVGLPLEPGGQCPLMLAAGRGHVDICRELLAYGANMREVDDDGRTAWLHASAAGRFEVCHLLTGYGHTETVVARQRTRPANPLAHDHGRSGLQGSDKQVLQSRIRVAREAEDTRPAVNSSAIMAGVPAVYGGRPLRGFHGGDQAAGI